MLVFLPGVGEIRRTARELENIAADEQIALMQLYGDMPLDEQQAVLAPAARRKIVLATNVAETSITIEGITAVIDTGWARVLRNDPKLGMNRLELERISQAAAAQRAGRAGRTAPEFACGCGRNRCIVICWSSTIRKSAASIWPARCWSFSPGEKRTRWPCRGLSGPQRRRWKNRWRYCECSVQLTLRASRHWAARWPAFPPNRGLHD